MLAGRTAGEPQSCISAFADDRLTVSVEAAVVYDAGDTIYVARSDNPRTLDTQTVLVIERTGNRLLKQDFVRTVDRTLGFTTGVVFLGDFVPYRLASDGNIRRAYCWEVRPGKEEQFRSAWRRGTELIRRMYGSLGSRFHRAVRDADKIWFVSVAEWPDEAS